jgi:hypothetical protein
LTKNNARWNVFKKYWDENILEWSGSNWVNLSNPRLGWWDRDNLIESKSKPMLKDKTEKKHQLKKINKKS